MAQSPFPCLAIERRKRKNEQTIWTCFISSGLILPGTVWILFVCHFYLNAISVLARRLHGHYNADSYHYEQYVCRRQTGKGGSSKTNTSWATLGTATEPSLLGFTAASIKCFFCYIYWHDSTNSRRLYECTHISSEPHIQLSLFDPAWESNTSALSNRVGRTLMPVLILIWSSRSVFCV